MEAVEVVGDGLDYLVAGDRFVAVGVVGVAECAEASRRSRCDGDVS